MSRRPNMSAKGFTKGDSIRFVAGTYKGKKGTFVRPSTAKPKVRVLTDDGEKETSVFWSSFVKDQPATSEDEYILRQHSDVEELMEKLANKLVECRINTNYFLPAGVPPILEVFWEKVKKAQLVQENKGHKATWRDKPAYGASTPLSSSSGRIDYKTSSRPQDIPSSSLSAVVKEEGL